MFCVGQLEDLRSRRVRRRCVLLDVLALDEGVEGGRDAEML